jgi:hypothetical protein
MKYYEFTYKTSFSGDNPVQTGIARVRDDQPLELIRSEIAGGLKVGEVTLTSADVDNRGLETKFHQHRETAKQETETGGVYANLGVVEVILFR